MATALSNFNQNIDNSFHRLLVYLTSNNLDLLIVAFRIISFAHWCLLEDKNPLPRGR